MVMHEHIRMRTAEIVSGFRSCVSNSYMRPVDLSTKKIPHFRFFMRSAELIPANYGLSAGHVHAAMRMPPLVF